MYFLLLLAFCSINPYLCVIAVLSRSISASLPQQERLEKLMEASMRVSGGVIRVEVNLL